MKRLMWTAVAAAVVGAGGAAPVAASPWVVAAAAGTKESKETKVRFSTVSINQQEVMRLAETPDMHADERADEVQKRLEMVMVPDPGEKFQPVKATDVKVESVDGAQVVRLRNQNVIQVTNQDAKLAGLKPDVLAQRWAESLRGALQEVKVSGNGRLPENWVTVAKGELTTPKREAGTKPKGGGAGGMAPRQPDKQPAQDKQPMRAPSP